MHQPGTHPSREKPCSSSQCARSTPHPSPNSAGASPPTAKLKPKPQKRGGYGAVDGSLYTAEANGDCYAPSGEEPRRNILSAIAITLPISDASPESRRTEGRFHHAIRPHHAGR